MPVASTTALQNEAPLAFAHIRRIKQFYVHLTHHVVVTTMLFIVSILTSTAYSWAVWRALGWRGGVVSQALAIFDKVPFLTAD